MNKLRCEVRHTQTMRYRGQTLLIFKDTEIQQQRGMEPPNATLLGSQGTTSWPRQPHTPKSHKPGWQALTQDPPRKLCAKPLQWLGRTLLKHQKLLRRSSAPPWLLLGSAPCSSPLGVGSLLMIPPYGRLGVFIGCWAQAYSAKDFSKPNL